MKWIALLHFAPLSENFPAAGRWPDFVGIQGWGKNIFLLTPLVLLLTEALYDTWYPERSDYIP